MPKKILFFTHYSALYGANRSLLNLLTELKNLGVHSFVIIPEEGDLSNQLLQLNIPFAIHKFNWWCGAFFKRPVRSWRAFKTKVRFWQQNQKRLRYNYSQLDTVKSKLANFEPDWVHTNSSVFNFGLLFAKKYEIPHIWHLRESQEQYNLNWYYSKYYINKNFQQSDIVISVSQFLKKYYSKKNNIKKIEVLYNGVIGKKDLAKVDAFLQLRLSRNPEALVFGIVGLIHPKKGQEDALKAFAEVNKIYPQTKLLIVGGGDPSGLLKLAGNLEITSTKVEFLGHISDPFDAFVQMDVALMCSRWEGMGRVTVEAMAAKLPVIGYKDGGTIELIEEGINGLFYEYDYTNLIDKMIYMVQNQNERKKMGENGRKIFEEKFTSEIYAESFMKILENYKN